MARKYRRDNRGRFAGGGGGATARGGRLKTASGKKRETQTMKAGGAKAAGTIGKPKGLKPGAIKPKAATSPAATTKTSKAAANLSKTRYKRAQGTARALNRDLKGASATERRNASSATSAVKGMERRRSTSAVTASASSPRKQQLSGAASRVQRANANFKLAMRNEAKGPGSKMSRKASVAKRAQAIYAGRINPKQKTAARLTKTQNPQALARRVKKIKDNTAAKPARAAAVPKTGQEIMKANVRKVQNQKLRQLNQKIKEAGPNATNLRVEKLKLQSNMSSTRPKPTAKQVAKSEKQNDVVRGRIAEMRRQNARIGRAQSNVTKNADVRSGAPSMSKASFARRPSKKTMRSQLRAENALAFYANPAKALKSVNKRKPGFRMPRAMR